MSTTRLLTLDDCVSGLPGGDGHIVEDLVPPPSLLERLLNEQQLLPEYPEIANDGGTAVEEFARDHAQGPPAQAKYYSRLLPATPPGPGEQYSFEVDLDRCSGCKACVTACHSLNGLDTKETWRDVGLLVGGTSSAPYMQHVTTACHHCLEPGCLIACPVNAYEKDKITGIVRHLDDQCFGCQYCTLACPYNVPKYHAGKGIVRKCDMCSSRLAVGEAPACVQACPHEAIAIRTVKVSQVVENCEADPFLPGAPDPALTLPTTTYRTRRQFPRNTLPADWHAVSPQHPHWPLVIMLVLTQLSAGALTIGCVIQSTLPSAVGDRFQLFHAASSVLFGLLALAASTLHLGRPQYAFRGILGFRHSWMSREIAAFGLFAGLAVPYSAGCWLASPNSPLAPEWKSLLAALLPALGWLVSAAGLTSVFCSVMIYVFTRREYWNLERTTLRFFLTVILLGASATGLSLLVLSLFDQSSAMTLAQSVGTGLAWTVLFASVAKLSLELLILRHLADHTTSALRRTAQLLSGRLRRAFQARLLAGVLGGIVVPLLLLDWTTSPADITDVTGVRWSLWGLLFLGTFLGELLERYLFFAAVAAPRMPGGPRS